MVVRSVHNATNQASVARDTTAASACASVKPVRGGTKLPFVTGRLESRAQTKAAQMQVAAVMDAPLAVYPLVQHQKSSVFPAAVNHLLTHVISGSNRQTAFLHATTQAQQHCAVALQPGDTWGSVINEMGIKDTQLLMYVKPVDDPKDFCGEDVEGLSCAEKCDVGTEPMQGSVGDCCEDEHQGSSSTNSTPDLDLDWAYLNSKGLDVQYYGLVAQNISFPSGNGCYLLKTMTEKGNPACHCMHYSLMRVCEGRALADQASNFWTRECR